MRMIVKKPASEPEYSLHDAHIMELQAERDTLRLVTQYGYVCTAAPYGQVDGDVELTGVDWDSSYIYIIEYQDVLCGNCGAFTGKKMTLETFLLEGSQGNDLMDYSKEQVITDILDQYERHLTFIHLHREAPGHSVMFPDA